MAAGQGGGALGWSGLGSFCCGLALIVSATVLNLAHDRMSPREVEALPVFLSDLYDMAGKLGVTLLLAGGGLALILLGLALRCDMMLFSRAQVHTEPEPEGVYFYTADDKPDSTVGPNGGLVLQTRKYLQPKRSKSGSTTGNAARPGDR